MIRNNKKAAPADESEVPQQVVEALPPPATTSSSLESSLPPDDDIVPVDDFVPVEGLPPDKTMLSSEPMEELVRLADKFCIDHSKFSSKEEYVVALQARYPKTKAPRNKLSRLNEVASFLDSGKKAQEGKIEVDDLFQFLLQKLKVEKDLQEKIMRAYTLKEKISVLGDCVR